MNLVVVAGERLKQPSRAHPRRAPSDHHLTGDQLAVRRKNDAEDLFRVAFEGGEQTARRYFPNLDRAVFARGGEKAPVGREATEKTLPRWPMRLSGVSASATSQSFTESALVEISCLPSAEKPASSPRQYGS